MSNIRLIARLDIKGSNLIKGIHLEGLRVVGDPNEHALRYYKKGIDEIIFMDAVASLYGRNNLKSIVSYTARNIFVPLTVGGGIRSIEDVQEILNYGADKVAINTAAINRPNLISEIAQRFGSQCMVLSVEAKRKSNGGWEAYTDNGREHTGLDALEWINNGVQLGAGEILLTSVDQDGTQNGFDTELIQSVSTTVPIPVIASGGMGNNQHLADVIQKGKADAIAIATVLHYGKISLKEIRQFLLNLGISIRPQ